MPSPFPGMDPYLEKPSLWVDFHNNLASEIQARLNREIQPRYTARLTPYVTYEVIEIAETQSIRPDVAVLGQPPAGNGPLAGVAGVAPVPVLSAIPNEVALELFSVEIRAVGQRQLVTAIEILSPVNERPGHPVQAEVLDYLLQPLLPASSVGEPVKV